MERYDCPETPDNLAALNKQLQMLSSHLVNAHETEKRHIVTELNDSVVQSLSALSLRLSMLQNELPPHLAEARAQLAETLAITREIMDILRLLARRLRPLELDTLGLNAALKQVSEEWAQQTGVAVAYSGQELPPLPEAVALSFYRLTQEAFVNIARHAQATRVAVHLAYDGRALNLQIEDNGRGFAANGEIEDPLAAPGLGLFGFMMQFAALPGRLTIWSQPDQGTRLTAVASFTEVTPGGVA